MADTTVTSVLGLKTEIQHLASQLEAAIDHPSPDLALVDRLSADLRAALTNFTRQFPNPNLLALLNRFDKIDLNYLAELNQILQPITPESLVSQPDLKNTIEVSQLSTPKPSTTSPDPLTTLQKVMQKYRHDVDTQAKLNQELERLKLVDGYQQKVYNQTLAQLAKYTNNTQIDQEFIKSPRFQQQVREVIHDAVIRERHINKYSISRQVYEKLLKNPTIRTRLNADFKEADFVEAVKVNDPEAIKLLISKTENGQILPSQLHEALATIAAPTEVKTILSQSLESAQVSAKEVEKISEELSQELFYHNLDKNPSLSVADITAKVLKNHHIAPTESLPDIITIIRARDEYISTTPAVTELRSHSIITADQARILLPDSYRLILDLPVYLDQNQPNFTPPLGANFSQIQSTINAFQYYERLVSNPTFSPTVITSTPSSGFFNQFFSFINNSARVPTGGGFSGFGQIFRLFGQGGVGTTEATSGSLLGNIFGGVGRLFGFGGSGVAVGTTAAGVTGTAVATAETAAITTTAEVAAATTWEIWLPILIIGVVVILLLIIPGSTDVIGGTSLHPITGESGNAPGVPGGFCDPATNPQCVPVPCQGSCLCPVTGTVTQGPGGTYSHVDQYGNPINAIDIGIPNGTPVYSVSSGTVSFAGMSTQGYGNLVIIDNKDGTQMYYGHLQAFLVKTGDSVTSKQEIALSDNTGNSSGPHLHFEYRGSGAQSVLNLFNFTDAQKAILNGCGGDNKSCGGIACTN